jgi:hypothetical protein
MKKLLVALVSLLAIGVGATPALATPASDVTTLWPTKTEAGVPMGPSPQWSYCTGAAHPDSQIHLYDNQGYCGTRWSYYNLTRQRCYTLVGTPADNQAAATYNELNLSAVRFFTGGNCLELNFDLQANTSHPNLYGLNAVNFGNQISSLMVL